MMDFGKFIAAINDLKMANISDVCDLAFEALPLTNKLALERAFDEHRDYFRFYSDLDADRQADFNAFVTRISVEPLAVLAKALREPPIRLEEIKAPDHLVTVEIEGDTFIADVDQVPIFNMSKAAQEGVTEGQITTYSVLFASIYNQVFANRISPTNLSALLEVGYRGLYFTKFTDQPFMSYYQVSETSFYICWRLPAVDNEPRFIDLLAFGEKVKERILNNFSYTLTESRRGLTSLKGKASANLDTARMIFRFLYDDRKDFNLSGKESNVELSYTSR